MYKFIYPKPILINLSDKEGFELRVKAEKYLKDNLRGYVTFKTMS